MSEDRFGDLGKDTRSAAERFEELDRVKPEPVEGPPEPPRPRSPYSWVVGIAAFILIAAVLLWGIRTEGPGALGPEEGSQLPLFAAPLVTTGLDRDANIAEPCAVRLPHVVNICDLRSEPLVLSFMFTRFADCEPQLDRIERVRGEFPGVRFVGVVVREPKKDAAEIVRKRGWGFPVALDRDGQVSNIFGIGGCPTTVFAKRGGVVSETRIGELDEAELRASVRRIVTR
ncbi:MAG TPA: redoxin domain-containing protein [Thermoleophilaceae bacterium]|nr:redoxin domain-containing protein [Thermoleophilaceae bacterium]